MDVVDQIFPTIPSRGLFGGAIPRLNALAAHEADHARDGLRKASLIKWRLMSEPILTVGLRSLLRAGRDVPLNSLGECAL